ncbi:MAG: iron ABC transporter permease, partial [Cetobacterium sp.]
MERTSFKKNVFILYILIPVSLIFCISVGSVNIPYNQILLTFGKNLLNLNIKEIEFENILWYIRIPRVILAFIIGGGLGITGAAIQSLFQNPMADAGILGISSGASLGAIIAVALGLTSISLILMPILSILLAFIIGSLVYKLGSYKGKASILGLILSGIAIKTLVGSFNSFILTNISENQVREYLFWSLGSLNGRRWDHVNLIGIPVLLLSFLLFKKYKELNICLLGEEESLALGIDIKTFRKKILFICSSITALVVCVSGNIGFIGLVIPHMLRIILKGSDNKKILPLSFIGGGIFLQLSDLIARVALSPKEISVGIITSFLG